MRCSTTRYILGAVEERITEADQSVARSDNELAGLELANSRDAHVEALLDRRQRSSQLAHGNVDDDDVTGRRAYVQVLVFVVDLTTHTHRQTDRLTDHGSQEYQRIRIKIIDIRTSRLLLIFPEIFEKFPEI